MKNEKLSELFELKKYEPHHVGLYRVGRKLGMNRFAWWNGKFWHCASRNMELAIEHRDDGLKSDSCYNGDYTHFCGLAEKAR